MRVILTGEQMQQVDSYTIEHTGIPSLVLMERAAMAVAEETQARLQPGDRIWAVCGTGNNGADAVAAARMLHLKGFHVRVIRAGREDHASTQWKQQKEIAARVGLMTETFDGELEGDCDVLIDGIFGVGLSRPVEGIYRALIEQLASRRPRLTVAVDIPSGIHSGNGRVMGTALRADLTVTFGYEKLGCACYPGKGYAGEVKVKDIGFPPANLSAAEGELIRSWEKEDLSGIPARQPDSNKGTYGKILLVAGSKNMAGAAYLSALAAYRTGAGLVRILTVEENRQILQTRLPEAVIETYTAEEAESPGDEFDRRIERLCGQSSVIILGPGLGRAPYASRLTESVLAHAYVPLILDADGLNAVADHPRLFAYLTENIVITPHLGEMARLTGQTIEEIKADVSGTARAFQERYKATCVLKDSVTATAGCDGTLWLNASGNGGMAKAGSGDVLTGVIGGLLALGLDETASASLGVFIHGLAGDLARDLEGEHSLLAEDIAGQIGAALRLGQKKGDRP